MSEQRHSFFAQIIEVKISIIRSHTNAKFVRIKIKTLLKICQIIDILKSEKDNSKKRTLSIFIINFIIIIVKIKRQIS